MGEADDVLAPACGLLELGLGAREQQILDLTGRQPIADVHHHRQANDLR